MKSHFYHIQINIDFKNISFYRGLFSFLGWSTIFEMDGVIGFKSETTGDIWFVDSEKKEQTDYDKMGMNHVSIRVENQEDINKVTTFIKENNINPKFDTPRHRPDFASTPSDTYYQVMFISPDNILFEIVFIGAKNEN